MKKNQVGFLKIYASYVNYFPRAQSTLKSVTAESKNFQQWLYVIFFFLQKLPRVEFFVFLGKK